MEKAKQGTKKQSPALKPKVTNPPVKITTTAKPTVKQGATKSPVKPVVKATAKPVSKKPISPKVESVKPVVKPLNLPDEVFNVKVSTQAIFDSIMSERSSRRQGTHAVKTRAQVSGGGKKPYRQKGTGNARAGSSRIPQWVGGGVVWGPRTEKNYSLKVNKKVKRLAYLSAYTLKAKEDAIVIHDFKKMTKPNTKAIIKELEVLKLKKEFKKILIVTNDELIWKSVSNIEKVFATRLSGLTVETIINADLMIISKENIDKLGGKK